MLAEAVEEGNFENHNRLSALRVVRHRLKKGQKKEERKKRFKLPD